MKNNGFKYKRKRIIIFAFEGKNNKTESIYFSHFRACNDDYVIKSFSTGVTDPIKMIESTKSKRKAYDYNAKEDKTFIFMDCDNNKDKIRLIKSAMPTLGKDIALILSNPTFELWFLNHFIKSSKAYLGAKELIEELSKYIPNYQKNRDYYKNLLDLRKTAIINSKAQQEEKKENPSTNVWILFTDSIIKDRD